MRTLLLILAAACSLAVLPTSAHAQGAGEADPTTARAGVRVSLSSWLSAFNNLELDRFLSFFSKRATIFPPRPHAGATGSRRLEPGEVRAYWAAIFRDLRERSERSAAPFLSIAHHDLRVDEIGEDGAVVTFHLSDEPWPNRRTLVWAREGASWRIVHLHASRIADPAN